MALAAAYDASDDENFFMLPGTRTGAVLDVQNNSNVSAKTPGLWQFFLGPDGEAPGTTPDNPLLPVVVDGSFFFSFPEQPDQRYFIDPPVAVGYDYTVESGPNIASVIAPMLHADSLFDLYTSSNSCATYSDFVTQLTGNVEYTFATPQSCFSIRDIALAANLDPMNPTAFVTGITFDSAGMANVTQTPITQNVDNATSVPGPLPLLGAAAALRWTRRLRRRLLIATRA